MSLLDLNDRWMARAIEWLKEEDDGDVSHASHSFPYSLRGIAGEDQSYALPGVVAIGPLCHPSDDLFISSMPPRNEFRHLRNMQHAKWAAAYWFCRLSGRSTSSEVYQKVLSVVDHVRRYYYGRNDLPSFFNTSFVYYNAAAAAAGGGRTDTAAAARDAALAAMMFADGCFLLQYMMMMMGGAGADPLLEGPIRKRMSPSGIRKDIFMLENQIPYLVLEALMEFTSVDVRGFITKMGMELFRPGNKNLLLARERKVIQPQARRSVQFGGCIPVRLAKKRTPTPVPTAESSASGGDRAQDYKPPHLLGLLLFHVTGSAPETAASASSHHDDGEGSAPSSQPCSAAELARIGVKLTPASTTACLVDMAFTRKPVLFAKLSLPPLFLDDDTACWLVNMAALEETVVARNFNPTGPRASPPGLKLSSYLSVLAMLVDGDEDVRELRRANLLHGTLSNTQALAFFKSLGHNLRLGRQYHAVLEEIDRYKRDRSVRIAVYRFAYDNYKTLAAVLSITGVLIGIFKTLLSFKQH